MIRVILNVQKTRFAPRCYHFVVIHKLKSELAAGAVDPQLAPDVEEAVLMSGRELSLEELTALACWLLERFTDEDWKTTEAQPTQGADWITPSARKPR